MTSSSSRVFAAIERDVTGRGSLVEKQNVVTSLVGSAFLQNQEMFRNFVWRMTWRMMTAVQTSNNTVARKPVWTFSSHRFSSHCLHTRAFNIYSACNYSWLNAQHQVFFLLNLVPKWSGRWLQNEICSSQTITCVS